MKNVKDAVKGAGKAAAELVNKAHDSVVNAIDVNGDGSFDLKDVKDAVENVGSAAQKFVGGIKDNIGEGKKKIDEKVKSAKLEADRKSLRPIFADEIDGPEFPFPKLLMITEGPDKAHKESEACKGSIGFLNKADKMDIVTIYKDNVGVLDATFFPDIDSEVYYVNPTDRDNYISLSKYTEFLIIQRMNEMQRIAQSLGAKRFNVRIVTKDASSEMEEAGVQAKVRKAGVEVKGKSMVKRSHIFDYTSNNTFIEQEPKRPELKYLAKDPMIQNLIEMRLNGKTLQTQTIQVQLSDTSGIKIADAAKIGVALKAIKCSLGAQFVKETETQSRSYFEYTIEFY